MPDTASRILKGTSVDVGALFWTYWFFRRKVLAGVGLLMLVTLILSLLAPKQFVSFARFVPVSEERVSLGQLGSLASLAGMDLSSMTGGSTSLNSALYSSLLHSYPFLKQLLDCPLKEEGAGSESFTLRDYYGDRSASLLDVLHEYTIGLPWTLKNVIFPSDVQDGVEADGQLIFLTEEEEDILIACSESLGISVDKETSLVQISVTMEDPVYAAKVTQFALDILHNMVIDYRTSQVRANLDYVEARLSEARSSFEAARMDLFAYRDANRNTIAERSGAELQDLEIKYRMASSVYELLSQQREQALLAVKKETPVFSVIEPVVVPVRKSKPNVGMNLVLSMVLGAVLMFIVITAGIVQVGLKASLSAANRDKE